MQNAPSNILRPNSPAPNGQDIRMKHFLTQFHFQELDFQNFLIFTYVSKKVITGGPRLSGPQLPRFHNTGIEKKVPSPQLSGIPRNNGIP